jgi:protein gp37
MSTTTKIQWTDATWNIARGCTKVDEDCKFCYMYRESLNGTRYEPKTVTRTKTVFNLPLKLKEPSKIFTSSLTDFFHEDIDSYREDAWDIIRHCPQHTFQILTKRPERLLDCLPSDWGDGWPNVWLGTSIGNQEAMKRLYFLLQAPAAVRFVSFEPLWDRVDMNIDIGDLCLLDWAIIGGESGNENGKYRYRPCKIEWIEELIKDLTPTTAIFIKQLGTHLAKELKLSDRHGGIIEEWPTHLQIRQFPTTGRP